MKYLTNRDRLVWASGFITGVAVGVGIFTLGLSYVLYSSL